MIILIVGAYIYVRSSYLPCLLASVNSVIELLIQLQEETHTTIRMGFCLLCYSQAHFQALARVACMEMRLKCAHQHSWMHCLYRDWSSSTPPQDIDENFDQQYSLHAVTTLFFQELWNCSSHNSMPLFLTSLAFNSDKTKAFDHLFT